jgi:hypothetical protein
MPELPSYRIRRAVDGAPRDAGALYDLPLHAQVCLHTDDPELVLLLESEGMIVPARPPYLDAAGIGIHGAYRSRPQINVFLEPPIQEVAEAFARALAKAGAYAIEPTPPTSHAIELADPGA